MGDTKTCFQYVFRAPTFCRDVVYTHYNSILLVVSHPPGMPPFHLVRWMLSYSVLYGCFAAGHQGRVRGRAQKSVSATHLKEHGSLGSPSLVQVNAHTRTPTSTIGSFLLPRQYLTIEAVHAGMETGVQKGFFLP